VGRRATCSVYAAREFDPAIATKPRRFFAVFLHGRLYYAPTARVWFPYLTVDLRLSRVPNGTGARIATDDQNPAIDEQERLVLFSLAPH
jgi:hypothetical protein